MLVARAVRDTGKYMLMSFGALSLIGVQPFHEQHEGKNGCEQAPNGDKGNPGAAYVVRLTPGGSVEGGAPEDAQDPEANNAFVKGVAKPAEAFRLAAGKVPHADKHGEQCASGEGDNDCEHTNPPVDPASVADAPKESI